MYRFDADPGERIASALPDAFAMPVLLLLLYCCYFSFNARVRRGHSGRCRANWHVAALSFLLVQAGVVAILIIRAVVSDAKIVCR